MMCGVIRWEYDEGTNNLGMIGEHQYVFRGWFKQSLCSVPVNWMVIQIYIGMKPEMLYDFGMEVHLFTRWICFFVTFFCQFWFPYVGGCDPHSTDKNLNPLPLGWFKQWALHTIKIWLDWENTRVISSCEVGSWYLFFESLLGPQSFSGKWQILRCVNWVWLYMPI